MQRKIDILKSLVLDLIILGNLVSPINDISIKKDEQSAIDKYRVTDIQIPSEVKFEPEEKIMKLK